jgi:hypothetical protein
MTSRVAISPLAIDRWDAAGLHSEILPDLYMGGTADHEWVSEIGQPSSIVTKERFDTVVTLFGWAQVPDEQVVELRYSFRDAGIAGIDLPRLLDAARFVYQRWQAGDRVLIRCQAGLNRSGLVTALTLMLHGYSVVDAIDHIRTRRSPDALFNEEFVAWLQCNASEAIAAFE